MLSWAEGLKASKPESRSIRTEIGADYRSLNGETSNAVYSKMFQLGAKSRSPAPPQSHHQLNSNETLDDTYVNTFNYLIYILFNILNANKTNTSFFCTPWPHSPNFMFVLTIETAPPNRNPHSRYVKCSQFNSITNTYSKSDRMCSNDSCCHNL